MRKEKAVLPGYSSYQGRIKQTPAGVNRMKIFQTVINNDIIFSECVISERREDVSLNRVTRQKKRLSDLRRIIFL